MLSFFIGVLSIAIGLLCGWLILLILMQRPSANAGMGASLGGGAAESAFGGEASNVLTRWTVYGIIAFFLGTLCLSLIHVSRKYSNDKSKELLPVAIEKSVEKGDLIKTEASRAPQPTAKASEPRG